MIKPADKVIILLAIIFVGWLYVICWTGEVQAEYARVIFAGQEQQLIKLSEDQLIESQGKEGISQLEVKNWKIRFVSSPCPNQHCVHAGWLAEGGELAACLPNKLAVEVIGQAESFDTINF